MGYYEVHDVSSDGAPAKKTFEHLRSEIGAEEAEEGGVEHLLRDIKDLHLTGTLTDQIQEQSSSLLGLHEHLLVISRYLEKVVIGSLPVNHQISYLIQEVFNLLPNVRMEEFV